MVGVRQELPVCLSGLQVNEYMMSMFLSSPQPHSSLFGPLNRVEKFPDKLISFCCLPMVLLAPVVVMHHLNVWTCLCPSNYFQKRGLLKFCPLVWLK